MAGTTQNRQNAYSHCVVSIKNRRWIRISYKKDCDNTNNDNMDSNKKGSINNKDSNNNNDNVTKALNNHSDNSIC